MNDDDDSKEGEGGMSCRCGSADAMVYCGDDTCRACDVGKRARVDEGGRISGRVYLTKIREVVLKIKSAHCRAHCVSDEFVLFYLAGYLLLGLMGSDLGKN